MYWFALAIVIVAAAFDLRRREIPNMLPALLFLGALAAKLAEWHPVSWGGIALGAGAALAVSWALFALGGLGGGDVKLLTALGAALGAAAFLPFVLLTALFGGVAGLVARKRGVVEIAYAPAMLLGLAALLPALWLVS